MSKRFKKVPPIAGGRENGREDCRIPPFYRLVIAQKRSCGERGTLERPWKDGSKYDRGLQAEALVLETLDAIRGSVAAYAR